MLYSAISIPIKSKLYSLPHATKRMYIVLTTINTIEKVISSLIY